MSKIHYFQRYATEENTVTNNTLQLFARIYNYSASQASILLSEITGENIEIGIEINQQKRGKESVPDGTIIQRSFKILVEAKRGSDIEVKEVKQVLNHAANFKDESQKVLLLLTKQKIKQEKDDEINKKISKDYPDVIFKNITYEEICHVTKGLFKDYEYEMSSLVDDYVEYCNDTELFDQSKFLLRIVPCGKSIDINKKYGVYFQPSDRGYTKHSYVGIYANKSVQYIWAIDSVFEVEFDNKKLEKTLIQGRDTHEYDTTLMDIIKDAKDICGWKVEHGHRFFCGKPIQTDYKKSSSGGIQGARLINLKEKVGEFADVNELADKLKTRQWE